MRFPSSRQRSRNLDNRIDVAIKTRLTHTTSMTALRMTSTGHVIEQWFHFLQTDWMSQVFFKFKFHMYIYCKHNIIILGCPIIFRSSTQKTVISRKYFTPFGQAKNACRSKLFGFRSAKLFDDVFNILMGIEYFISKGVL